LADYCAVADLKPLAVDSSDVTFDVELASCVTTGSALVDVLLNVRGLVVPVVVPELVRQAAAHFAAWVFTRKRDADKAESLWRDGNRFLNFYAESKSKPYVGMV
jgi:hypothetical protein